MSEHEMEKEMPGVRGAGEEVLGTLAPLKKKQKKSKNPVLEFRRGRKENKENLLKKLI